MTFDTSILYYSLPGLAIMVIVESVEMVQENRFRKDKNIMFTSLFIGVIAIFITTFLKTMVFFVYDWMYQFRLFTLSAGIWWVWVLCFFGDDFSYYWLHRFNHQVRFLWASHAVHHSAEIFTFTSGIRVPWTSILTGNFIFWLWMPLLGFNPAMIITMKSISVIYQFWLHTEKIRKMPKWFEAFFNTPSHHRVHHGCDEDYLDKNYGGTLILFDHLFGTFLPETHQAAYGLTTKIKSSNPVAIVFNEWGNLIRDLKTAHTFRDCLNFIFNSPRWTKR
jgi:sterol desaturase/sphingolipid hydroxylase (fatty acid hydroxylase superfamily)